MEFPTHRVVERKAAIIHELTHVFFPNGNRLLAEGLAVYMQHLIGGNPAFPNFGRPPHELMPEISREIIPGFRCGDPASLEQLSLARLDRIATPNPLTLQIGAASCGVDQKGQARLYTIAGSFTQFLIETYGLTKFWGLYRATPLLPSQLNAGALERWHEIFGCPLQALAAEWKVVICEITKTEEPRNA
jgi:hypothetical protein